MTSRISRADLSPFRRWPALAALLAAFASPLAAQSLFTTVGASPNCGFDDSSAAIDENTPADAGADEVQSPFDLLFFDGFETEGTDAWTPLGG